MLLGSTQGENAPVGSFGTGGAGGVGAGAGGCVSEQVTSTATYLFLLLGQGSVPPFMWAKSMSMSQEALPTHCTDASHRARHSRPARTRSQGSTRPRSTTAGSTPLLLGTLRLRQQQGTANQSSD